MQSDHEIGLEVSSPRFNPGRQASCPSIRPIVMLLIFHPLKKIALYSVISFPEHQLA